MLVSCTPLPIKLLIEFIHVKSIIGFQRTWYVVDSSSRFVLVIVVQLSDAGRRHHFVFGRVRRRVAFSRHRSRRRDVITSGGSDLGVEVVAAADAVVGRQSELVAWRERPLAHGAAETVDVVDEMTSSHDEVAALERHRTCGALRREPTANRRQHRIYTYILISAVLQHQIAT